MMDEYRSQEEQRNENVVDLRISQEDKSYNNNKNNDNSNNNDNINITHSEDSSNSTQSTNATVQVNINSAHCDTPMNDISMVFSNVFSPLGLNEACR